MVTQLTCLEVLIALCVLLNTSIDAQDEIVFEGKPTDFLPLRVGNQWTYEHFYYNDTYDYPFYDKLEQAPEGPALRAIFGIPGYPFYGEDRPPEDLHYVTRDLTIEITHTETIEGHDYFIFSDPEYDWPPVPNFFLAGQKVRFSDEGILLFRRQEQDIPLYDFSQVHIEKHYTMPEYPLLYDENNPVEIKMRRTFRDAVTNWFHTPARLGQAFTALFQVSYTVPVDKFEYPPLTFGLGHIDLGQAYFVTNYGIALYYLYISGVHWSHPFENSLQPVSAVIDGEAIAYPYVLERTNVQPSSWGQVKVRHDRGQ